MRDRGALALRRRALRAGDRAAPRRAGGDARVRRRRALPDGALQQRARRPATPRAAAAARCAPAPRFDAPLDPALVRAAQRTCARGRSCSSAKKMRPTPRARRKIPEDGAGRAGPRARAHRRRRLGPADRARACATGASTTSSSARWPTPCAAWRPRRGVGDRVPSRRTARRSSGLRAAARRRARAAGRRRSSRGPSTPRRSARWPTPPAGRQRPRALPRRRRRAAGRPACCSTTSASAAGRSRWSAGSCGAAARHRCGRSRWPARSDRSRSPARSDRSRSRARSTAPSLNRRSGAERTAGMGTDPHWKAARGPGESWP